MAPDPTGPNRHRLEDRRDEAFRRFLDRATEDPTVPRLDPVPVADLDRTAAASARPPLNRRLLVAAAVILIASGTVVALIRPSGTTLVGEPAASTPSVDSTVAPTPSAGPDPVDGTTTGPGPSLPEATEPESDRAPTGSSGAVGPDANATDRVSGSGGDGGPVSPGGAPSATPGPAAPGSTGPATTATVPASGTRLALDLGAVPRDAANGRTVHPSVGPALTVERAGAGTIETDGQGRVFGPGGQQRTDYAIVTLVGADVADLIPASGRATVTFTPRVDVLSRTVTTGRNIHTWFEIVSEAGPDQLVTGVSLQVDPEIGPYLSGAVQGTRWEHTLSSPEIAELASGRSATLTLTWTAGQGRVLLNGRAVTSFSLDRGPVTWRSSARLSVGGSATWGAGYFTTHDDAVRRFEIVAD
ncbi:MAG: hypothetical protein ACK5RL_01535 [Acidimicrobiales bacterium]